MLSNKFKNKLGTTNTTMVYKYFTIPKKKKNYNEENLFSFDVGVQIEFVYSAGCDDTVPINAEVHLGSVFSAAE